MLPWRKGRRGEKRMGGGGGINGLYGYGYGYGGAELYNHVQQTLHDTIEKTYIRTQPDLYITMSISGLVPSEIPPIRKTELLKSRRSLKLQQLYQHNPISVLYLFRSPLRSTH